MNNNNKDVEMLLERCIGAKGAPRRNIYPREEGFGPDQTAATPGLGRQNVSVKG